MLSTIFHAALCIIPFALGQSYTGSEFPQDPRINIEITIDTPTNGASTTPDGRVFLVLARVDGSMGAQVVEYNRTTNTSTPYPNQEWNSYMNGSDPATHFIGVNSQRIGPDGQLYIVDKGAPSLGAPPILPYGPKIVVVDINTNNVSRVYQVGNATDITSFIDDIRFHNSTGKAYITDAGHPGIIVLDLVTGDVVRVLNDDISTKGLMPPSAEGNILYHNDKPFYIYADQMEVSPDGTYFYYQPCAGGMSRIETQYLDEAFYNSSLNTDSSLSTYVEPFAVTPSTGGTAIDADGNIYVSDTNSQRIIKTAPNGTMSLLVQDPRLLWVDAMWVDGNTKSLWMPAAQLNRGTVFNNGTSKIVKPLYVYSIYIGVGPSPIDHA